MRKNIKNKILLSILAAGVFYLPAYADAAELKIDAGTEFTDSVWFHTETANIDYIYHESSLDHNKITINNKWFSNNTAIYGAFVDTREGTTADSLNSNSVIVNGATFNAFTWLYGAYAQMQSSQSNTPVISGNNITIMDGSFKDLVDIRGANAFMYNATNSSATFAGNNVTISGGTFSGTTDIYGANAFMYNATNSSATFTGNNVTISGGTFSGTTNIYASYFYSSSNNIAAEGNSITISGGTFSGTTNVYASYLSGSNNNSAAKGNSITISGNAGGDAGGLSKVNLYGSNYAINKTNIDNNNLIIDGWSGTVGSLNNFSSIVYEHVSGEMKLEATNVTGNNMSVVINSVAGGDYAANNGDTTTTIAAIKLNEAVKNAIGSASLADELQNSTWIYGDYEPAATTSATGGIYANKLSEINATLHNTENKITVDAKIASTVLAGKFIDVDGEGKTVEHTNSNGETSLTIGAGFNTHAGTVAGAYAAGDNEASGGKVYIESSDYNGTVYAGFSENGTVGKNTAYIGNGAQAINLTLAGDNQTAGTPSSAVLTVTGNSNTLKSIGRFDTITFDKVALNGTAALTVQSANLDNTAIFVNSLAGGNTFKTNDKVTLLTALTADAITGNVKSLGINDEIIQAGVAQNLTVSAAQEGNSINLTVTGVGLAPQTNLVAETHAATAAFVNQGTDLINDSLDVLGRDGSYGVKTFAAVQGNRSTYDVADDLKINGWSVIAGFGAENKHKGGDFAWGVFYENGSGNYRTYNTFNNEFFRGDGSMVYNGGGIAARYENAKGVYTEGSLRAGMLKNEMDNALRDGAGNSYGYETESTYYGAHIGVGQIFELSENTDLDVYGKFFHTYVEGDTVTIGGDTFDFDSITSDRLRVGARATKQQAKVNTYYGLAYEYEFNGDADMKAAGIKADTQSFGGGTGIAELGFNYQPGTDSPWNFDLNLRGYVGERQGGSFNVQATYTF